MFVEEGEEVDPDILKLNQAANQRLLNQDRDRRQYEDEDEFGEYSDEEYGDDLFTVIQGYIANRANNGNFTPERTDTQVNINSVSIPLMAISKTRFGEKEISNNLLGVLKKSFWNLITMNYQTQCTIVNKKMEIKIYINGPGFSISTGSFHDNDIVKIKQYCKTNNDLY